MHSAAGMFSLVGLRTQIYRSVFWFALMVLLPGFLGAEETPKGRDVVALWQQAKQGELAALLEVGEHFLRVREPFYDTDPARDFPQLEKWLQVASTKGSAEASYLLGWLYQGDYPGVSRSEPKAVAAFEKAARAGSAAAMLRLGRHYFEVDGRPADLDQAEKWFRSAVAKSAPESDVHAEAQSLLESVAFSREQAAGRAALVKRADSGDLEAQHELANALFTEATDDEDSGKTEEAMRRLTKAASGGFAAAQYELGTKLYSTDLKAARAWIQKAVAQNYGPALESVGLEYLLGADDIARDPVKGIDLILQAVQAGSTAVASQLVQGNYFPGMTELDARTLRYDNTPGALARLTAAAKSGSGHAQFWLGHFQEVSDGAAATAWFAQAAAQGHPRAMMHLSLAYHNGSGVPRDLTQAYFWLSRAALLTYPEAQWRLAHAYLKGTGTTADPARARYWFGFSANTLSDNSTDRADAKKRAAEMTVPLPTRDEVWATALAASAQARLPGEAPAAAAAAVVAVAPRPAAKPAPPKPLTLDEHRTAAAGGNAESMYQLGLADLAERAKIPTVSGTFEQLRARDESDFRWMVSAARAGHPEAQFMVGTHWLSAETEAGKKSWLEKAAAQGHVAAKERLAANAREAENAAVAAAAAAKTTAELRTLADQGDADAALRLLQGRIKEIATTIVADFSAAQKGQPTSGKNYKLGQLDADMMKWADLLIQGTHLEGMSVIYEWTRDTKPEIAYVALLLRRHLADADTRLALTSEGKGINTAAGWESARVSLEKKLPAGAPARLQNVYGPQFNAREFTNRLGVNFEKGRYGFPRDPARALVHYRAAAEAGLDAAQSNLARFYESGIATTKDLALAREWYGKAAAQGLPGALTRQAELSGFRSFATLKTLSAEEREALTENEWAAAESLSLPGEFLARLKGGEVSAMVSTGIHYRDGTSGFPQAYRPAFAWLTKASAAGHADAESELGRFHLHGWGRPVNKPLAFACYARAAERGSAMGQYNLGMGYLDGGTLPRDPLKAHDFLQQAAAKGLDQAKVQLERLQKDAGLRLLLAQRAEGDAAKNLAEGVATILSASPARNQTTAGADQGGSIGDAMLAAISRPNTGDAVRDLQIMRQSGVDAMAGPVPPPPVPKAGSVLLANLQMDAIPSAATLERSFLLKELEKQRSDMVGLQFEFLYSSVSRFRLKTVQELLDKGDKAKARGLLLESVQAGLSSAVPVLQKHFPDEPVVRPGYRADRAGLWPGDAGWAGAQAKFEEGRTRWDDNPAAARPLLEAAAAEGLAEAYAFLALNRKDLPPEEYHALLNTAFDLGHAAAAWRQRGRRAFNPRPELGVASVEKLTAEADAGDASAGVVLSFKLLSSNPAAALERIGKLANAGHGGAEMMVAAIYAQGRAVPPDAVQVFAWLARAAIKGSQDAQIQLGDYLAGNYGGEAQPAFAKFWYLRAAAFPREGDYLARVAASRAAKLEAAPAAASRAFAQARILAQKAVPPVPPKKT